MSHSPSKTHPTSASMNCWDCSSSLFRYFDVRFNALIAEVEANWPDQQEEILRLLAEKLRRREAATRELERAILQEDSAGDGEVHREQGTNDSVKVEPVNGNVNQQENRQTDAEGDVVADQVDADALTEEAEDCYEVLSDVSSDCSCDDCIKVKDEPMVEIIPEAPAPASNQPTSNDTVSTGHEPTVAPIIQEDASTSRVQTRSQSPSQVVTRKMKADGRTKKFACRFIGCRRVFKTDYHLAVHERIHLNIKPFRCTMTGCSHESVSRNTVARHIRHVHWRLRQGTTDNRDASPYIAVNRKLLTRRLP